MSVVAMHEHVVRSARHRIYDAASVPRADCILVPGARIHADGQPYPLLADRLATALDLFQHGKATRIVLSGRGGGGLALDEVAAMRRWLSARGVPADAMRDDALGLVGRAVAHAANRCAVGTSVMLGLRQRTAPLPESAADA